MQVDRDAARRIAVRHASAYAVRLSIPALLGAAALVYMILRPIPTVPIELLGALLLVLSMIQASLTRDLHLLASYVEEQTRAGPGETPGKS
ncbi:MAG: hypothetical protein HYZ53_26155 [Planctomycetes bacterium]|nr:hypothetical protein [Planctomycetota bacterium]